MVLPYSSGHLVRSLVRIPGSGLDRQAEPAILDLSKVSPLASTVPVPRTVPAALSRHKPVPSPAPPPPSSDKLAGAPLLPQASSDATPVASTRQKRLREEDPQGSISKAARKDNSSPSQLREQQTHRIPVATVTVPLVSSQQIQQVGITEGPRQVLISCNGMVQVGSLQRVQIITAGPSATQQASTPSLQTGLTNGALVHEVNKLKKENEELNEKLRKLRDIFRNKDSLRYIANKVLKVQ